MSKLYLIGLGGTGARVIRSFVYFLSAGMKLNNINDVVPILIDPDLNNGNLEVTQDLINEYRKFQTHVDSNGFFATKIKYLGETVTNSDEKGNYSLTLSFIQDLLRNRALKDIIELNYFSDEDKRFIQLLFNQEQLDVKLNKGFLGNPNVGSIIAEKIEESAELELIIKSFTSTDKLFIISSIFGGTGASIFPILLKKFRNSNNESLRKGAIGAITYLPYFQLKRNEQSYIDSFNFIPKTKAALRYYANTLSENLNAHYFIGDRYDTAYDNYDGGEKQKNPAHILEFLGASAIFHFNNNPSGRYFEYGLNYEAKDGNIYYNNEPFNNHDILKYILLQVISMKLTNKLYNNEDKLQDIVANNKNYNISKNTIEELINYYKGFSSYIKEIEKNKRSLVYFNTENTKIKDSVKGIENEIKPLVKGSLFWKKTLLPDEVKYLSEIFNKNGKISDTKTLLENLYKTSNKIYNDFFSKIN